MLKYTDNDLLQILHKKKAELGRTPKKLEVNQFGTIIKRFGSWSRALKLAQLTSLEGKTYTNDELIAYLKKAKDIIEEKGKQFTVTNYINLRNTRKSFPSDVTYKTRFGSWNKALKEAGLSVRRELGKWREQSDEELLNILKEHASGSTLTIRTLRFLSDVPPESEYIRRFGSWSNTIKAAGIKPLERSKNK